MSILRTLSRHFQRETFFLPIFNVFAVFRRFFPLSLYCCLQSCLTYAMTLVWYFAGTKPIPNRIIYGSIFVLYSFYCQLSIAMKYVASDVFYEVCTVLAFAAAAANIILNIPLHSFELNVYVIFPFRPIEQNHWMF